MPARGQHVFISYSQEDSRFVSKHIRKYLDDSPLRSWQDVVDVRPGVEWTSAIDRALRNALVLVVGPDSGHQRRRRIVEHVWRREFPPPVEENEDP